MAKISLPKVPPPTPHVGNLREGQRGPLASAPQIPTTSQPVTAVPPAPAVASKNGTTK
jgi:hypothetical protein